MVSSETIAGIDVIVFGFALVPILIFGISGNIALMIGVMTVLLGLRLLLQLAVKDRITVKGNASPRLGLDSWSYNAMFLSIGGALAIVFGFDGGLVTTVMIAIPVLILWKVFYHLIYGERREKYDPYTQDIGDNNDNDVI